MSALYRDAGSLVLRVFNPTDETTTVTVDGRRGWLVDLRGRPGRALRAARSPSPPSQIATLQLADPAVG